MRCSVTGCDREVRCRHLCQLHYSRLRRTGRVDIAQAIPERRGWTSAVSVPAWEAFNGTPTRAELLRMRGYEAVRV